MSKTIGAMKQAHAVLQSGDPMCEVTAASILREAIAAEEAGEADQVKTCCATGYSCGVCCPNIDSLIGPERVVVYK